MDNRTAARSILTPVLPSPSGRHFVDHRGQPVFWLGDTLWDLFRMYTREEALELLRNRWTKGFNVILVMLLGLDETKTRGAGKVAHLNIESETPWLGNDPLRPNEKYFRHVDSIIRLGEMTGQTFVVGIYHMWHEKVITTANARAWARWVANRYRDVPNLIWCMYPKAEPGFVAVSRELAAGLREGDGGSHLISVHPDPAVASSSFLHDEEWLAFNMIQTWAAFVRIEEMVRIDYTRTPVKPVVMAEGHYEEKQIPKPLTPHDIRKQAWWSQLAGAYHVYGHDRAVIAPREWRQWMDSPGARQVAVFREVITALPAWWTLVPDENLIAAGAGSGFSRNMAARCVDGSWLIAYLSEPSSISLRVDALAPGRRVRAAWIDPRSGEPTDVGIFPAGGTSDFTSPQGWEDAVLLVEPQ